MSQGQSAAYSPICPLCREPIRLEDAKTDEDGQAIHENCYLASLKGTAPTTGSGSN